LDSLADIDNNRKLKASKSIQSTHHSVVLNGFILIVIVEASVALYVVVSCDSYTSDNIAVISITRGPTSKFGDQ
jgi:hypothetical protein